MAEDDESVRKLTRDLLEEYGYTVMEAVDGEDAVNKFKERTRCDTTAPARPHHAEKNSKEAYDEIKQLKPDIRVIFSSGYEAEIIQKRGKLAKNLNFLAKPVIPEELFGKDQKGARYT